MHRLSTLFIALALAACVAGESIAAPSELADKPLRDWVAETITVLQNEDGKPTVLIRRGPVRADIRSEVPSVIAEAKEMITNFAAAFGLDREFTVIRPNLTLLHTAAVNDDDRPNRTLFQYLRIPGSESDAVMQMTGWSDGCGSYRYQAGSGEISMSVLGADTSLTSDKLRSCVLTGILKSFGFGIRVKRPIVASDGYIQYLILANVLAACDKRIAAAAPGPREVSEVEKLYVDCAVEGLKARTTK